MQVNGGFELNVSLNGCLSLCDGPVMKAVPFLLLEQEEGYSSPIPHRVSSYRYWIMDSEYLAMLIKSGITKQQVCY